jgi:hypothetical protein
MFAQLDAGTVVFRVVKRTMVTGAAADQPWQQVLEK